MPENDYATMSTYVTRYHLSGEIRTDADTPDAAFELRAQAVADITRAVRGIAGVTADTMDTEPMRPPEPTGIGAVVRIAHREHPELSTVAIYNGADRYPGVREWTVLEQIDADSWQRCVYTWREIGERYIETLSAGVDLAAVRDALAAITAQVDPKETR